MEKPTLIIFLFIFIRKRILLYLKNKIWIFWFLFYSKINKHNNYKKSNFKKIKIELIWNAFFRVFNSLKINFEFFFSENKFYLVINYNYKKWNNL